MHTSYYSGASSADSDIDAYTRLKSYGGPSDDVDERRSTTDIVPFETEFSPSESSKSRSRGNSMTPESSPTQFDDRLDLSNNSIRTKTNGRTNRLESGAEIPSTEQKRETHGSTQIQPKSVIAKVRASRPNENKSGRQWAMSEFSDSSRSDGEDDTDNELNKLVQSGQTQNIQKKSSGGVADNDDDDDDDVNDEEIFRPTPPPPYSTLEDLEDSGEYKVIHPGPVRVDVRVVKTTTVRSVEPTQVSVEPLTRMNPGPAFSQPESEFAEPLPRTWPRSQPGSFLSDTAATGRESVASYMSADSLAMGTKEADSLAMGTKEVNPSSATRQVNSEADTLHVKQKDRQWQFRGEDDYGNQGNQEGERRHTQDHYEVGRKTEKGSGLINRFIDTGAESPALMEDGEVLDSAVAVANSYSPAAALAVNSKSGTYSEHVDDRTAHNASSVQSQNTHTPLTRTETSEITFLEDDELSECDGVLSLSLASEDAANARIALKNISVKTRTDSGEHPHTLGKSASEQFGAARASIKLTEAVDNTIDTSASVVIDDDFEAPLRESAPVLAPSAKSMGGSSVVGTRAHIARGSAGGMAGGGVKKTVAERTDDDSDAHRRRIGSWDNSDSEDNNFYERENEVDNSSRGDASEDYFSDTFTGSREFNSKPMLSGRAARTGRDKKPGMQTGVLSYLQRQQQLGEDWRGDSSNSFSLDFTNNAIDIGVQDMGTGIAFRSAGESGEDRATTDRGTDRAHEERTDGRKKRENFSDITDFYDDSNDGDEVLLGTVKLPTAHTPRQGVIYFHHPHRRHHNSITATKLQLLLLLLLLLL